MGKRLTDTDAAILILPPAEAAAVLGRTMDAVYTRGCEIDAGYPNRDRLPRTKFRREYFATGAGPREEIVPVPVAKCRYCERKPTRRGLCKKCYRWVQRLVEAGVVTWGLAEWLWLGGKR